MKLETSEDERAEWKAHGGAEGSLLRRLHRDIDTLLAEVERLRAERRPFSDGLAQKVIDEQVRTIDRLTAKLAALLSRWPGGWRPIETAPKDGTAVLLRLKQHFTDNRPDLDRFRGVHFVGRNVGSSMDWCFAAPVGYGGFPDEWFDGWMPIPEPPNE